MKVPHVEGLEKIGQKLSDFKEIKKSDIEFTILGIGNFGYTEKMQSKLNNKYYAIKKLNKHDPNFIEKDFFRETEIMIHLEHENVAKLYGYFEDKEKLYKYKEIYKNKKNKKEYLDSLTGDIEIYCLVLEYIPNGTLQEYYKKIKKALLKEIILRKLKILS